MRPKIVPDVVPPRPVLALPPDASVRRAARTMAEQNVAALLVSDDGVVRGIVTERDITARVVAPGLDPDSTPLSRVMTADPYSLRADDSIGEALELMRRHGFRHLPVLDGEGRPLAMVSVRDLYAQVQKQMELDLLHRDAWIMGIADAWGDGKA
jgi:Predicted signal-transduction protein containing cAMP-binding and CBS domains